MTREIMNNNRVFIFVDVQAHLNPTSTRGGVDSQTKTNRPIGGQSIPIIGWGRVCIKRMTVADTSYVFPFLLCRIGQDIPI